MSKVIVIGAAKSGIAAARFLADNGWDVTLYDGNSTIGAAVEAQFPDHAIRFIWGEALDVAAIQPDLLVMSPGVPLTIAPVLAAKSLAVPIISEPELAFQYSRADFVAITGTNGKTTTTTLVADLLEGAFPQVLCAGNIGLPLISEAPSLSKDDVVVAEMSSFQLETIQHFKPRVAIFLNLTPDHLDRHGTLEAYGDAKARVFENQDKNDVLIANYDDALVKERAQKAKSRVLWFSQKEAVPVGMWLAEGRLYHRLHEGDNPQVFDERAAIPLPGMHNTENIMAAALAALVVGQSADIIRKRLHAFQGVAHRMEMVATVDGVHYVNDSKGTNPDASIKALSAYDVPVVAILGGRNKGNDFSQLTDVLKAHARGAVVLGEATDDFLRAFQTCGFSAYRLAENFDEAVFKAKELAQAGDVVLLSPACASWDMFSNFEERGNRFKKLVRDFEEKSH